MNEFLKTKRGLEYLLETSPSDMPVATAVQKAEDEYYCSLVAEQEGGWL
jgi:hypothetical protein